MRFILIFLLIYSFTQKALASEKEDITPDGVKMFVVWYLQHCYPEKKTSCTDLTIKDLAKSAKDDIVELYKDKES